MSRIAAVAANPSARSLTTARPATEIAGATFKINSSSLLISVVILS